MVRFVLVGLITLATVPGISPGQHTFDYAEAYNSYLQDLVRRGLSPEDRATLQRWAFRAYNACETGDLEDPKSVFESGPTGASTAERRRFVGGKPQDSPG